MGYRRFQKSLNCYILKNLRDWERPSDHVPVVAEFKNMSNIKLNLKKNVAYIKIDNVLTKNSLDRNDLKRITDFLIKIGDQNLTCLVISSSGDILAQV